MRLIARMALVALIIGTSVTVAATERVDASLVLAAFAGWSFVPILQLLTGTILIRGASASRIRVLEQYFATHWPWSLWILALHAIFLVVPASRAQVMWLVPSALIPAVWTTRLLARFCREALALDWRECRTRVMQHEALSALLLLVYVDYAVGLWPRVLGALGRS